MQVNEVNKEYHYDFKLLFIIHITESWKSNLSICCVLMTPLSFWNINQTKQWHLVQLVFSLFIYFINYNL